MAVVVWGATRARETELERARAEADRTTLLHVARESAGTLDRQELLDRVQPLVAKAVQCERVVTYFLPPEGDAFRVAAHHGLPADLVEMAEAVELRPDHPIIERGRKEGVFVVTAGDRLAPPLPADIVAEGRTAPVAVAPLVVGGKLVGALAAARDASRADDPFLAAEVQLLESIARQLAVAMKAADLYRQRQEEAQVSRALALVANELIASLRAPHLLERLCRATAQMLECESSRAYLWRPGEDAYVPLADHGSRPEQWEMIRVLRLPKEMARESIGRLHREGVLEWTAADLPAGGLSLLARRLGITRLLGIALRRGRETTGYLTATRIGGDRPFSAVQRRIAAGIGRLASLALDHALAIEELERASRLKDEFVATMSHELRTPLNAIIGYGELLLEGACGPLEVEQEDALRRSGRAAQELLELVNGILDLSRLESGAVSLELADVSLGDLLAEIHAESLLTEERLDVFLEHVVEPALPAVETDRAKLKIVLSNLVGNALKFTPRGRVRVEVRAERGGVEIRVIDTGIGIDPEILPFMFEPFRQGDGSSTRRYGGVGLGLHIVRRLLEVLGGTIEVDSAVGRGSTFTVWLPARPADHRVSSMQPAKGPPPFATATTSQPGT